MNSLTLARIAQTLDRLHNEAEAADSRLRESLMAVAGEPGLTQALAENRRGKGGFPSDPPDTCPTYSLLCRRSMAAYMCAQA